MKAGLAYVRNINFVVVQSIKVLVWDGGNMETVCVEAPMFALFQIPYSSAVFKILKAK